MIISLITTISIANHPEIATAITFENDTNSDEYVYVIQHVLPGFEHLVAPMVYIVKAADE